MRILSKLSLLTTGFMVASATGIAVAATTQTVGQPSNTSGQVKTRSAEAKLKACRNREAAIDNIFVRISDRGQKQLDLFSDIATRAETFYVSKGKTLSNYNALVADVSSKKDAAVSAVNTVKAKSVTFKCGDTDSKGLAASFKDALRSEITALQAYRTSVNNLIVGIKSVQGTTTSAANKTTASTVNRKVVNTDSVKNKQASSSVQSAKANDVASAPTVNSINDLIKAQTLLDQTNPSGSNNTDARQLDAQLAKF